MSTFQRERMKTMPEKYSSLFSPVSIGNVTLRNRVILTAMGGIIIWRVSGEAWAS